MTTKEVWVTKLVAALGKGRGVADPPRRQQFARALFDGPAPTIDSALTIGLRRLDAHKQAIALKDATVRSWEAFQHPAVRKLRRAILSDHEQKVMTVGFRKLLWAGRDTVKHNPSRAHGQRDPLEIAVVQAVATQWQRCLGKSPGKSNTTKDTPFGRVCDIVQAVIRERHSDWAFAISATARVHGVENARAWREREDTQRKQRRDHQQRNERLEIRVIPDLTPSQKRRIARAINKISPAARRRIRLGPEF